jgi:hypothetical protein
MQTFDLSQHIAGDTWNGLSSLSAIDLDNNPIDLTDSLIEMKVKLWENEKISCCEEGV